jgi:cell division transport system permease protein
MFARRTDLPLDRDVLSRFLPWLIAFMVYLASLALAGVLILDNLAGRWDTGISATLTVQIPATGDAGKDARRTTAVIEKLRAIPDVVYAEPVGHEQILALLEPWLGTVAADADLPLPHLIDVKLNPGGRIDAKELSKHLAKIAPGTLVDDHGVWLDRLLRLLRAIEALATGALALMGLATAGTVVFTTRTGLAIHQDVIEVLHLIGARDAYIARQFGQRALALGLRGGLFGLALAVPTLLGVGSLASRIEAGLLPSLSLAPLHWVALAALPPAAAVIAMLTARLTVIRTLSRMP